MSTNRMTLALAAAGTLLVPGAALADTSSFLCPAVHTVRNGGVELLSTAIHFRNADPANSATIERITIRDVFGLVVHDSGPSAGAPHPLNTDFAAPLDITVVPPGGSFYLNTRHIWGTSGLPDALGGEEAGFSMAVTVQVSMQGRKDLLFVGASPRIRDRVFDPAVGAVRERATRSQWDVECQPLVPGRRVGAER